MISLTMDRYGIRILGFSSVGMTVLQLVMGICSAMQKMSERLLLADHTESGTRGALIGTYHFWTSVCSGFAVILGGYLIDWLAINALFYMSALLYAGSAWMIWRNRAAQVTP